MYYMSPGCRWHFFFYFRAGCGITYVKTTGEGFDLILIRWDGLYLKWLKFKFKCLLFFNKR